MELIVILFGVLILCSGVVLMVTPSVVFGFMERRDDSAWLYAFAIVVRVLLGLLLIVLADNSRFPLVMVVLGWLFLAAAVFLQALGLKRFTRFMRWLMPKVKPWARWVGPFAVVFGAFLVYAFV